MKLSNLTVLLGLTYHAHAYIVPDLPDGVYTIALDKKGNALGEPFLLYTIDANTKPANTTVKRTEIVERGLPAYELGW